ncbi:MAG: hypothetical protein GXP25_05335 [Planctomycetes bacterium]|nr:hypothetical protein [Planctomycetota bacterium]
MIRSLLIASGMVVSIALIAVAPAGGDILYLKSGKVVEGRVVKDDNSYEVETKTGKMKYPATMVEQVVEKKTHVDEFYEQADALKDTDSAGRARLGQWCLKRGMERHATTMFREALRIDPKNLTARIALADLKAKDVRHKLRKLSSGSVRAELKKQKPLKIKTLCLDIQARPNSERVPELSEPDFGFLANLQAKGYKLLHSEKKADAVYQVLYKTGLSGSYEIEGKKYSGMNIRSDAALIRRKGGKEIWKGEVYGFTGAKVRFREGVSVEDALRSSAIEDFQSGLVKQLPMNYSELKKRLGAAVGFSRGKRKRMVKGLDSLIIDLTKETMTREDVLGAYGCPDKQEFDIGGVERWLYEDVKLEFEWRHPKEDVQYSLVKILPGYPSTFYGIEIGWPISKLKKNFDCKLAGENADQGTGAFVIHLLPDYKAVVKVIGGRDQTVEWIEVQFGKGEEAPEGKEE